MKKNLKLKKHHAKPVRKRHIGLSLLGLVLVVLSSYALGFGSSKIIDSVASSDVTKEKQAIPSTSVIKSSYGFNFAIDQNQFQSVATKLDDAEAVEVTGSEIGQNDPIISVTIRPRPGKIEAISSGSSLSIRSANIEDRFTQALANRLDSQTVEQVAAEYFTPVSSADTSITLLSSSTEIIGGLNVQKSIYQVNTDLGGTLTDTRTFAVHYSSIISNRPFNISINGLVGGSAIPPAYAAVIESLSFDLSLASALNADVSPIGFSIPGFGSASADTEGLEDRFLADLVSPSVVKIYNGLCGKIKFNGVASADEICNGGTGTGFFITDQGHIATNGHVVVLEAEDLLVQVFVSNPNIFVDYLTLKGLSDIQISEVLTNTEKASSAIAAIYEEPDDTFTLVEERRNIMVALSDETFNIDSPDDFFSGEESKNIKRAELIDYDYAAKDIFNLNLDDGEFSASDVAILKIDLENTPALILATEQANQNEDILVLGFPGDAENALVDDEELVISATNGSISSIRDATGGGSKLYQSDADASQGNSGGPALNNSSEVIGIVTYRFSDGETVNASKTYIRDARDLQDLADRNNIVLGDNTTYVAWQQGLKYYSLNRFTKSQEQFDVVTKQYPAHRLAASYTDRAQKGIDEGREIQDFPAALVILAGGIGCALIGLGAFLFIRHNKHHKQHLLGNAMPTNAANVNVLEIGHAAIPNASDQPHSHNNQAGHEAPPPTSTVSPLTGAPAAKDNNLL